MTDLQQYRHEIDRIDNEIVRLFEERMEVCEKVARYKIQTGKQVLDPEREKVKIDGVKAKAHTSFNAMGTGELFKLIMAISRKRQYQLLTQNGIGGSSGFEQIQELPREGVTVVFQGVDHVKTFKDAMEEVSEGRADYAVLPIENSTAGIVADIYDLLMEYQLYIAGEQIIRVEHVLLGLSNAQLEDIQTVYSHPQGLTQCKAFLDEHPCWKQVKAGNTAASAKKVSEEQLVSQAAIASREAGELFGLKVLAKNVCKNDGNATRFIILGRKPVYVKNASRISICFEAEHESGALYNMLSHIIYNGLNMTKIESRPIPDKNWQYRFFVDFDGNLQDSAVKNALMGIRSEANMLRILGNY